MTDQLISQGAFPMKIAPGIHILGNYYFNLFLISGSEKTALFETGISGVADRVIAQLDQLGAAPDYLIVSHPHADHITGLPGLRQRFPKARVLAAQGALEFVSHPKAGAALIKEDAFMSRRLSELGIAPGRPSLEQVPDLDGHQVVRAPVDLDLGGGTSLSLIPVEGHSPGNLIALEKKEQVLFCSDSLGFHYPGRGFWPLFFTGARPYLETIEMMAGLGPDIICPAHQGPITGKDVPACLDNAMRTAQDLIRQVEQNRGNDDTLAAELFKASYRDEFTLYTRTNIENCNRLLIKRARESLTTS